MSLSAKVVLLLCALFVTFAMANYAVQQRVILPSFETLEADLARTDMERITRAILRELDQLATFTADWGNWIDTYNYVEDRNAGFIDLNMTPSFVESAELDLVAFLDGNSRFVWRRGYDAHTHAEQPYALLSPDGLEPTHPFRAAIGAGQASLGIVLTERGPMLLAHSPVLDGNGNGPHRGAILFGRLLTRERLARLAEQAQVRLTIRELTPDLNPDADRAAPLATRIVRREDTNEVHRSLPDIFGRPALGLRVDVPRSVTAQGRAATGFASLSLLCTGAIVMLLTVIAMRRVILRPVSQMTAHAVMLGAGDDLTQHLGFERRDELGVLACEFDRMVDRLAEARRRLVDHSFAAGAAESASGVLHNVGNAMTPLRVTVAGLQQRFQAAPIDDVEAVLAELDRVPREASRRADLEQFLQLTAREMARIIVDARGHTDILALQSDTIQQALAQQARPTNAGPVVEIVRLAELVQRAAEMVPAILRQRLFIDLDASLESIPPVPVPRITLQQVFQNHIQNAAEAICESGRDKGRLTISAWVVPGEETDRLVVRFADNGKGIAPEHLPHIFQNGFTTKPSPANHGIGLHWCANALSALGGSLRVVRAEPDCGAVFELVLPLKRMREGMRRAA